MSPVQIIGLVAAVLSATSFLPQVLKALRSGETQDISLKMYLVTVAAFALWISYGIGLGDWVIIGSNSVSLAMSGSILGMKLWRG